MIGISLAYLPGKNIEEACRDFMNLQEEFSLQACEFHMECNQFDSAFYHADEKVLEVVSKIRKQVKIMGVHLPYLDLNPISHNPLIEQFATEIYIKAINNAAVMKADYVVFHARGAEDAYDDRQEELGRWRDKAGELGDIAQAGSTAFCFENADNVRIIKDMEKIICELPQVGMCLDIGHLFERVKLANPWERLAGRFVDRYLPFSSVIGKGMPYYEMADWKEFFEKNSSRIRCFHLHNHNGRNAHCPVTAGKINMESILHAISDFTSAPIIIEADYRQTGIGQLRKDLVFLKKVIEQGKTHSFK